MLKEGVKVEVMGVSGEITCFRAPKAPFGVNLKDDESKRDGLFEVKLTGWTLADGGSPVIYCAASKIKRQKLPE